jgi:hypothetical protein
MESLSRQLTRAGGFMVSASLTGSNFAAGRVFFDQVV